jgi:TRAP-type C4-dicarboxylate transport system permease small subunit
MLSREKANLDGRRLPFMLRMVDTCVLALENSYKYLALIFITITAIMGISKVLVRYLPIPGSHVIAEFTQVAFIWAVLMAIAWQVNTAGHMTVSVFYDKMSGAVKKSLSIGFLIIITGIGFIMIYYGILYIYQTWTVTFTTLGYPRWIAFYLPMPVSGVGVLVFGARKLFPLLGFDSQ